MCAGALFQNANTCLLVVKPSTFIVSSDYMCQSHTLQNTRSGFNCSCFVLRSTSGDKPDELVLGYWPCSVRISSIIAVVAQDVILPSLELAWRHGVPHWLRYIGFSNGFAVQNELSVADL